MTSEPKSSTSASDPALLVRVLYILLVLVALLTAVRLIFLLGEPSPAVANRIFAGIGVPSLALVVWPWPKSRLRAVRVARVISGVGFGSALFLLPLMFDHSDERSRSVNVGLLSIALFLHGLVILIATEYLRSANDNDQKDLLVTCREVLQRMERLEGRLEERDQALAVEVRTLTAAVERRELAESAKPSWLHRLRHLL